MKIALHSSHTAISTFRVGLYFGFFCASFFSCVNFIFRAEDRSSRLDISARKIRAALTNSFDSNVKFTMFRFKRAVAPHERLKWMVRRWNHLVVYITFSSSTSVGEEWICEFNEIQLSDERKRVEKKKVSMICDIEWMISISQLLCPPHQMKIDSSHIFLLLHSVPSSRPYARPSERVLVCKRQTNNQFSKANFQVYITEAYNLGNKKISHVDTREER